MSKKKDITEQDVIGAILKKHDENRNNDRFNVTLRRTAGEVKGYRRNSKLLKLLALILAILITIIFVIALMYTRYSSFTVSVKKINNMNASIVISDTIDFKHPTSKLSCPAVADITNIDESSLDMNTIGSVDGEANGQNYLCYTFYVKNNGGAGVNLNYIMTISNVEKNLDEACRIRVISSRNEEERTIVDYAKAASVDQSTHQSVPEPGTVAFEDRYVVCSGDIKAFMPDEVIKYTVVIWVHGPDPECTDDKIGGLFSTDMSFSVAGEVE